MELHVVVVRRDQIIRAEAAKQVDLLGKKHPWILYIHMSFAERPLNNT